MAARTLSALWGTLQFPENYKPSHSQFLALVKAYSGVLAGTTFSQTAKMMLGDRRNVKSGYTGTKTNAPSPETLDPEWVVQILEKGARERYSSRRLGIALDNDHVQVTVRYDVLAGDVSTALKLANVTRGYIESVERVFPELGQVERLREIMLKHSQSSFTDADNRFQVVVQTLKRLCGCASAKETFRPSDRNSKSQHIVRTMSPIQQEVPVQPTAYGLEKCYEAEATRWWMCDRPTENFNLSSKLFHLALDSKAYWNSNSAGGTLEHWADFCRKLLEDSLVEPFRLMILIALVAVQFLSLACAFTQKVYN
ncbi:hypothetical protein MMC14_008240 [Varicellaria rhodocarpa]|nr:hypothetical protein [Varicellaria rhodocarpa]